MKLFACNFFSWAVPEQMDCLWDDDRPRALNLVVNQASMARLTMSTGIYADKKSIETHIETFANSRGGYVVPLDDEFPNEVSLLIDNELGRICQHHVMLYGQGYAISVMLYRDYMDRDIDTVRKSLASINVDREAIAASGSNRFCEFAINEATCFTNVGNRRLLQEELYWAQ